MDSNETKPFYDYVGLAERWEVSTRTIKRLVKEEKIKPHFITPDTPRISASEVLTYERSIIATRLRRPRRVGFAKGSPL